jgi:large subunit ribosomal protein L25
VGEAAAETVVTLENATISLEAEATHIPEFIEVSVEGAEAGTQVQASDLDLPRGSSLQVDEELLVVNITQAFEMEVESDSDAVEEASEEEPSGEETVAAVAGDAGEAGEEKAGQ